MDQNQAGVKRARPESWRDQKVGWWARKPCKSEQQLQQQKQETNSVPPFTPFSNIPSGDLIAQELMGENKTAQLLVPANRWTECTPRSIEGLRGAVIVQNFLEDFCFDLNTQKTESNDSSPEPPDHREAVCAQSLPPSALGDFPFCGARGGMIWKSRGNFETCTQTPPSGTKYYSSPSVWVGKIFRAPFFMCDSVQFETKYNFSIKCSW